MPGFRKPSSKHYNSNYVLTARPFNRSESSNAYYSITGILRPFIAKSTIIWGCTALIILIFLSLLLPKLADSDAILPGWSNPTRVQGPAAPYSLSSILVGGDPRDKADTQSSNEMDTPAQLQTPQDQVMTTNEGIPLVSTGGNGKVVMLTGATGPGHFKDVKEFYGKVMENRMAYAKAHGIPLLFGANDARV